MSLSKMKIVGEGLFALLLASIVKALIQTMIKMKMIAKMKNDFVVPKSIDQFWTGYVGPMRENMQRIYHFRKDLFDEASRQEGKRVDQILLPPPLSQPLVMVLNRDPDLTRFFLKEQFDKFIKVDQPRSFSKDVMGDGIFGLNHGNDRPEEYLKWKYQRKTSSKLFTRNTFNGHASESVQKNLAHFRKGIEENLGREFNFKEAIFSMSFDITGEIVVGMDFTKLKNRTELSKSFDDVIKFLAGRELTPGWHIPYFRLIYESERRMKKGLAVVHDLCYKVIEERTKEGNLEGKGDILSFFLASEVRHDKRILRDVVVSFLVAGRDTTAGVLVFIMFLLSLHPLIQEELFGEIKTNLADSKVDFDALKNLPLLDGIVFETLRLFPVLAFNLLQASDEVILPDGRKVFKGTLVSYEPFIMGRDAKIYENPDRFIPHRWMRDDRRSQEFDPFIYPVFKAGPRICVGKDLALFEIKMILVDLVSRYRFDLPKTAKPSDLDAFQKDVSFVDGKPIYSVGKAMSFDGPLNLIFSHRL